MTHARYPYRITKIVGGVSGNIQYVSNGVSTQVSEDSVTTTNSRPLPVKLMSTTGQNVTINVDNANLEVQLNDVYDNVSIPNKIPDVTRLGDGTNKLVFDVDGAETVPDIGGGNGSVKVGGVVKDDLSLNAFTNDHRKSVLLDSKGRVWTNSESIHADAAAVSENSSLVGSAIISVLTNLVDGNKSSLLSDIKGRLWVNPSSNVLDGDADSESGIKISSRTVDPDLVATVATGLKAHILSDLQKRVIVNPQSHKARNVAITENPLLVGGSFVADMDLKANITDGTKGNIALDSKERIINREAVIYNATLPTYLDGNQAFLQVDPNGRQIVKDSQVYKGDWQAVNALTNKVINDVSEVLMDEKGRQIVSMEGLYIADVAAETSLTNGQKKTLLVDDKARLITKSYSLSTVDFIRVPIINPGPLWDTAADAAHLIPQDTLNAVKIVNVLLANVVKIQIVEDIGQYMALYTDAARTQLKCVLPLGGGDVEVSFAAGDSVYIGALESADITQGKIAINFLG